VLLALAATAYHAVSGGGKREHIQPPDLIVGHGVLGRLLARLTWRPGYRAVVWETNPSVARAPGLPGDHPDDDQRRDYRAIYDVSGDAADPGHPDRPPGAGRRDRAGRLLQPTPLSFAFPPAFMREARSAPPPNGSAPTCWPCAN
jgi:3-hydroxyethyl bacteriochlorophyllide a dehydrogenase